MKFDNVAYDKLFPREKPKKPVESAVEDFSDDDDFVEEDSTDANEDVTEDDSLEVE